MEAGELMSAVGSAYRTLGAELVLDVVAAVLAGEAEQEEFAPKAQILSKLSETVLDLANTDEVMSLESM